MSRILAIFGVIQTIVVVISGKQLGNVIEYARHFAGGQVRVPWISEQNQKKPITAPVYIEANQVKIRVECIEFDNESPRAYVYTVEGILVDTLVLRNVKDVCSKTTEYIALDEGKASKKGNSQEIIVIYLMAGKSPKCVERKYSVWEYSYMGVVLRKDYPHVECTTKLKDTQKGGIAAGGVVNVGPIGTFHLMDYNAKLKTKGDFKQEVIKDKLGGDFAFMCREDELTDDKKVSKAVLVHTKHPGVVLEKFEMNTCDKKNININRRIESNADMFGVVFRTVKGECYERIIKITAEEHDFYYEAVYLTREKTNKIRCPKKWEGDIGLNANRPWYRFYRKRCEFAVNLG